MSVPDFQRDLPGEYHGNAYPEQRLYRIRIKPGEDGTFVLTVEDTGGTLVGTPQVFDEALVEGIQWMASTNHGLDGYEDDWSLPVGMTRQLLWVLPTDISHQIVLDEGHVDEIDEWFDYALGRKVWTGGEEWEF